MSSRRFSQRAWWMCSLAAVAVGAMASGALAQQQTEACCFGVQCAELPPTLCLAEGGVPQGPGTDCENKPCVEKRPCCFEGQCFDNIDPAQCAERGGQPQPAGTTCAGLGDNACKRCENNKHCDDNNPCTIDFCNQQTGQCIHIAKNCDDGNACTKDWCDPETGECKHESINCDDGDPCTIDRCNPQTGECVHIPRNCNDNDPCTKDSCDPATGECKHESVNCDDGNPCTEDICTQGPNGDPVCLHRPKNCNDGNACTKDYCDPQTGECKHDPIVCDDQNPCTEDICTQGPNGDPVCVHRPKNCNDGNVCTKDYCEAQTGECKNEPMNCDDENPCTVDTCTMGPTGGPVCVHTPKDCDDNDPCTKDYCDPQTGECRHEPIPECQACCFPTGAACKNLPPGLCKELGGDPQGPGSNCDNTHCGENQVPKFRQPATKDREDIASNINFNAPDLVNRVVTDDFRSDGRPITSVRWWGSYLDRRFVPAPFGDSQVPHSIDGWLISFHRPLRPGELPPGPVLGLYFAPASAVRIGLTTIPACDGHPVFEYAVDLSKCCLLISNPDVRVPAADPFHCPAHEKAFFERHCYRYSLGIQAVVGATWADATGAKCCVRTGTNNFAEKDFWGWHATAIENDRRPSLLGQLSRGPALDDHCPIGFCPPAETEFYYGPWKPTPPVCAEERRVNMAFELWTNVAAEPPPCRPLLLTAAASVKVHGPAGEFPIKLPIDAIADAAVEPRAGGPTHVVLEFNQDIVADDGSLDAGDEVKVNAGTITGLAIDGKLLHVRLTGVPDQSCLRIWVEDGPDGITSVGSDPLEGDNDVHVRVLHGDVTGDGLVASADITQVKARSGQFVNPGNFRFDVNADGIIASADITQVKARSGNTASCP